ncbi:hypothetical protein [Tunicatimonas pelagia]|uniref:hypothetical protein n=1 Tax=Tunicatimonas pelagia TaxID=931531 RepID=UPI002664ECFF|nr:hypothetical protein [Tunicatimonas pelagia]WKN40850.1 hypothetical protein P0M28_17585 [Tunicatimonas pelagia]
MKTQSNVQTTVQQIKSNIDEIASETKNLKNGERFTKIQRMNDLRQIASALEDLDRSVNTLMDKQAKNKSEDA